MQCPKCQYARTAADNNPEWQCPSCGIAYAKATAAREAPSTRDAEPEEDVEILSMERQREFAFTRMLAAGVLFLLIGLYLGHQFVVVPYRDMVNGAGQVSIPSFKACFAAAFATLLGLIFIVQETFIRFHWDETRDAHKTTIAFVLALAASIGMRFFLDDVAKNKHYASAEEIEKRQRETPQVIAATPQAAEKPSAAPTREAYLAALNGALGSALSDAMQRGEVAGVATLSSGSGLPTSYRRQEPVDFLVKRLDYLSQSGCQRLQVNLSQGGKTTERYDGRQVTSAYIMRLVYSTNYCENGQEPNDGYAISIEHFYR